MAAIQAVGDPGVPLLDNVHVPHGSKEGNIQVQVLCVSPIAPQPVTSRLHGNGLGQAYGPDIDALPCTGPAAARRGPKVFCSFI